MPVKIVDDCMQRNMPTYYLGRGVIFSKETLLCNFWDISKIPNEKYTISRMRLLSRRLHISQNNPVCVYKTHIGIANEFQLAF